MLPSRTLKRSRIATRSTGIAGQLVEVADDLAEMFYLKGRVAEKAENVLRAALTWGGRMTSIGGPLSK